MKYHLYIGLLFFIKQVCFSICSEFSEISENLSEDVILVQSNSDLTNSASEIQVLTGDVVSQHGSGQNLLISGMNDLSDQYQFIIVDDNKDHSIQAYSDNIILGQLPYTSSQIQMPMPMQIPIQRINQGVQFGPGGRVQWLGGPVNFDNMVDCKFYRQNPGFCVPMSIYTPCSRCKAGVRTIFRTSYKVRCPGQDSFPPQLRPYFAWVPTSHRNPKRERGIFARWRRQFMCIVMAISDIPQDLATFWRHSQITFDSSSEMPQQVPLLLGPYSDQSTSLGYATNTNFITNAGQVQNIGFTNRNQNSGDLYELS